MSEKEPPIPIPVFKEELARDKIICQNVCACNSVKTRVFTYCATRTQCCISPTFQDLAKSIAIIDIILAFGITAVELVFTALPNLYIQIYNEYNMKREIVTEQYAHQTSLFLTVVIISLFILILEGWLFETLTKGALDLDRKKLNRWLTIRVIFFGINTTMTVYRILELQFCLYDLIYIPVAMYRLLEIILVKGLTTELREENINIPA